MKKYTKSKAIGTLLAVMAFASLMSYLVKQHEQNTTNPTPAAEAAAWNGFTSSCMSIGGTVSVCDCVREQLQKQYTAGQLYKRLDGDPNRMSEVVSLGFAFSRVSILGPHGWTDPVSCASRDSVAQPQATFSPGGGARPNEGGPTGASSVNRTAPEILAAVTALQPNFCRDFTIGSQKWLTAVLGPKLQQNGVWRVGCYLVTKFAAEVNGHWGIANYKCVEVDANTLEVTPLAEFSRGEATDNTGLFLVAGRSCI